ncbi:putative membrane protein YadS [Paenibacillus sp. V4I3]|uniref:putative sulfate exporter family transporter n=1 Tax=unclassified Paenibacillus TaxID=185978 RepID=UPI00277EE9B3|nr:MULTISPECIES: putative sulfate exporter family transporter [unclassified Paenibacillus]MDQ0874400.1 putative membrane protein YadS [Paenibacillus sp. V4I3]MDQ0889883.1 putative membrane protein YadS [Paenibacillus sp. V4I9]
MRKKREAVEDQSVSYSMARIFPWFILWFMVASIFNTLGLFSNEIKHYIGDLAKFMIVMALTGIGLSADFRKMMKMGVRPILFGLLVWFTVSLTSLVFQWFTNHI